MKPFCFLIFLFIPILVQSQEIETTAEIEHVTIFSNRAQISSYIESNLPFGTSKIIIKDVASTIDESSIQVGGRGDFILMSVDFEKDFITKKQMAINDSISGIKKEIAKNEMYLRVSEQEERMLMDNTKIKSDNDDLYSEDLEEMTAYFKRKLTSIGNEKLKLEEKKNVLNQKLIDFQNQLKNDPSRNLPLGKITLTVKAKSATTAKLNLKYLVYGTGWRPNYDIRVANTESPINLTYKAEVYQNTGIDWNNVKLSLSTASVNKRTVKPELNPQFLYFFENQPPMRAASMRMEKEVIYEAAEAVSDVAMESGANYSEISENELTSQFDISLPYSIKSGGNETVEVQELNMNAKYTTYVVPKFDNNGFLVAEIMDWEQYHLIPSSANVYFEDTYIGETYVRKTSGEDALKISLGRDERIEVKREEIKDYKERRTFGSNIRESFGHAITIRNSKNEMVNISIEDQIPVSQDSDIEVEIEDITGGQIDTNNGKVNWTLSIPPAQSRILNLKYTVKYPKDRQVLNL